MSDESDVWLPPLFPKQFEIFNCYAFILLVSGSRYSTKCVDGDTLICGAKGLQRIRRAVPADTVPGVITPHQTPIFSYDMSGQFTSTVASDVYIDPNKQKAGFRITLHSGYTIKCSDVHPLLSCVGDEVAFRTSSEIKTLTASGIDVWLPLMCTNTEWHCDYKVASFQPTGNKRARRRSIWERMKNHLAKDSSLSIGKLAKASGTTYVTCRSILRDPPKEIDAVIIDEDAAYLLGLLVGDGCMTPAVSESQGLKITSADEFIIEEMRRILSKHFPEVTMRHCSKYDWNLYSFRIAGLIQSLGMNKHAHNKTIPDIIIESPKPVVAAFLQGLFDTDGCAVQSGYVEYCSASRELSESVHSLLLLFGIASTLKFRPNKCRGSWHISITNDSILFYDRIGFRLPRKQAGKKRLPKRHGIPKQPSYPPALLPKLKDAYYSRHSRGAPRNTLMRSRGSSRSKLSGYARGNNGLHRNTIGKFLEFSHACEDPEIQKYVMHGKCFWRSVTDVEACSAELFDLSVPVTHNFIGNGFINHNTIAVLHKVVRHMWETPGACVGIFAKSKGLAKDMGSWKKLIEEIIPIWASSGIVGESGKPMEFLTADKEGIPGAKQDAQTRTAYFKIRNYWGTASTAMLFSIDNDDEVFAKAKNKEFSMVYVIELSMFKDPRILSTLLMCLKRLQYLKPEQNQFIADTNPDEDLGDQSWIYEIFYKNRQKPPETKTDEDKMMSLYYGMMNVIECFLDDNPLATPEVRATLWGSCNGDPILQDSWYRGIWGTGSRQKNLHFNNLFSRAIHVVGSGDGEDGGIDVDTMSSDLYTGWDIGAVSNHAAGIVDKWVRPGPNGEQTCFSVIDEHTSLGEEITIAEFVEQFMQKLEAIETHEGRRFQLISWADDTAMNVYRPTEGTYDFLVVGVASNDRIQLQGVPKPDGSVMQRVRLIQTLLRERRLFIAARCVKTIEMMEKLRRNEKEEVVWGPQKHIFDWLSYIVYMETTRGLMQGRPEASRSPGRLISV